MSAALLLALVPGALAAAPIQLKEGDVPADRTAIAGKMAPCQAPDLDPDGIAPEGSAMTASELSLREPLTGEVLTFTCGAGSSRALLVARKGERHLVLSHLRDLQVAPDGRTAYVAGAARASDGHWDDQLRIIDLSSKKATNLPHAACTNGGASWSGDALVTWGRKPASGPTELCVWSGGGDLKARATFAACWDDSPAGTVGLPTMSSTVGLLPDDDDVLYLYRGACSASGERCMVHLLELDGMHRARSVPIDGLKPGAACPAGADLPLLLDGVDLSSGSVSPRRLEEAP